METGHTDLLDDRYELVELVGVGGVAEVWRAHDRKLRRDVAVKVLSGPAARDPAHRHRIEREARALAAVSHPNVVGVFDYGEQPAAAGDPIPYIVMELVAGPDLAQYLGAAHRLALREALQILAGVLAGVEEAHRAGIVHGDLKPANVLMSPGGPKVTDFGVARILAEETGTTTAAATPTYASPEVLRGERPTEASDVYSAGCVAYELLTGAPPYTGGSFWEVSRQHLESPVPSLRDALPQAPPALDGILRRSLAKDPETRPRPGGLAQELSGLTPPVTQASPSQPVLPTNAPTAAPDSPTLKVTTPVGSTPGTEVLPPRPPRRPERARQAAESALAGLKRVPPGVAIAVLAVFLLALMHDTATATAPIPDLRGLEAEAARERAAERGFEVILVEVDTGGQAGTVIVQDPAPRALRARGTVIELQVTTGAPQTTVPEVAGLTVDEARGVIEQAGLVLGGVAYRPDDSVPAGVVMATEPPAGTGLDEGSAIRVVAATPEQPDPPATEPSQDRGGPDEPPGRGRSR